jgi:hypothetical protein
MNTYKFSVEVFIQGEDADDASTRLIEEFDYLFKQDNTLIAYTHPGEGELQPNE